MAFNRVKSSGNSLQVEVPWYRLEFLDALGYLIKIEKPNEFLVLDSGDSSEDPDLYGQLSSVSLQIASTTGGSSAKMKLGFTHVRGSSANEDAFDAHPFWQIEDGFAKNFQSFASKKDRMYSRSTQKTLQGGAYDDYLKEVKGYMNVTVE
jgi:hypothetical protein